MGLGTQLGASTLGRSRERSGLPSRQGPEDFRTRLWAAPLLAEPRTYQHGTGDGPFIHPVGAPQLHVLPQNSFLSHSQAQEGICSPLGPAPKTPWPPQLPLHPVQDGEGLRTHAVVESPRFLLKRSNKAFINSP